MKTNKKISLLVVLALMVAVQPNTYGMNQWFNKATELGKKHWKPIAGAVAFVGVSYWLWSNYNQNTPQPVVHKEESVEEDITIYTHYINLLSLINESKNDVSKLQEIETYVQNKIEKDNIVAVLSYSDKQNILLCQRAQGTPAQKTIEQIYQKYIAAETTNNPKVPSITDICHEMVDAINELTDIALKKLDQQEIQQKQKSELIEDDTRKNETPVVDETQQLLEAYQNEELFDQAWEEIQSQNRKQLLIIEKALDTVLPVKKIIPKKTDSQKPLLITFPTKVNDIVQKKDVRMQTITENRTNPVSPRIIKTPLSPRNEIVVEPKKTVVTAQPKLSYNEITGKIVNRIEKLIQNNDLTSCIKIHETFTDLNQNKRTLMRDVLKYQNRILLEKAQGTLAQKTIAQAYKTNRQNSSL